MDSKTIKEALVLAGLEVYRTRPHEVQVAERIRLHIMDSGIRVLAGESLAVVFSARAQRSDTPHLSDEEMFARARAAAVEQALAAGFTAEGQARVEMTDPMDGTKVLDVFFEVAFRKPVASLDEAVETVRWALGVERIVGH